MIEIIIFGIVVLVLVIIIDYSYRRKMRKCEELLEDLEILIKRYKESEHEE